MPIYEYRCPNGHLFEVFQRFDDAPVEVCEICGESPVTKVLYPVAVHFKGSGFYSTDYGRGGRKKDAASEGSGSGDGGSEAKTEKAEKKADEKKAADKKAKAAD